MRTVKDIISSKAQVQNSISPNAMVIDALNLLNEVNLSYLVVKEGEQYKGIFSERDYSRNVILKGRSSDKTTVKQAMSSDFPQVDITDTVEDCMNQMNNNKTRYLVAFDHHRFVGVITIHDLLRQVIFNKEEVFDHSLTGRLLDNEESGRIY
jgi:CBS domain-containing protein